MRRQRATGGRPVSSVEPLGPSRQYVHTVEPVVDVNLLPQNGRQLEGELHMMSGRYEVGGVVFDEWEVETLEDVA
jgi:hypothetical protein